MAVKIQSVEKNSLAALAGIQAGDTLVSINGNEIFDILDFRFYETSRQLSLALETPGGAHAVALSKGEYEAIGLDFETYLMDKQHSCRNKCVFCFIDQLPKGMRESLYFKDDDSRLSFLFGNYVTLTNMSERDVDRIIKMHISPINISVHTTNPELRVKMMGNRFAGDALRFLYRFAREGIKLNCQLVLCPGLNDGEELRRSLTDLLALCPAVQSVALVPLGMTKFREGLTELTAYDAAGARGVVELAEAFGARMLEAQGERCCYAADEFYLKAGMAVPPAEFYGAFDQLDNGIGLLADLREGFLQALEDFDGLETPRRVTLATGVAAAAFLDGLLDEMRRKCHNNLACTVVPIANHFFGESITVAGLLTGEDILYQLEGRDLGDLLLLPRVTLRREGDVFLDDVSLEELKKALHIDIIAVANDGCELLDAIIGRK